MKQVVKPGSKLNNREIQQINEAKAREFNAPPLTSKLLQSNMFFLLKDKENILALGALTPVNATIGKNNYIIWGIGGIIANVKSHGYGKKILQGINKYLFKKEKIGLGFCRLENKGFYEKCGLKVVEKLMNRFTHQEGPNIISGTGDACVIISDCTGKFIQKLLSNPNEIVLLDRAPNW